MKLHLKSGTEAMNYGCCMTVQGDYWTTAHDIASGITNLRKQVAKKELYDIRQWKYIEIYVDTLEIVW